MKPEGDTTASQPVSQTTTTTYSSTQWTTSSTVPIDPALQQQSQQPQHTPTTQYQHYPAYTSHYPQAAYPTHYQQYATPTATAQAQVQASASASSRQNNTQQGSSGMDTTDIATLNDALGSAGVDLRAEEETLQRSHEQHPSYRSYGDRSRAQPINPAFDTRFLGTTMRTVGTQHKVSKIPEDSVNYLALALRARLQELITAMIAASAHRTDTQFDRPASLYENGTPMWSIVVRSDVAKQLVALEKVEREEEMKVRRERKERAEMAAAHAAALAAQAAGGSNAMAVDGGFDDGDGGGAKKKRKKDGPGVTARNMSEDVRKKMSNAVATQAAGLGGKYAWMNAANAPAATTPKPKQATSSPNPGAVTNSPATTTAPAPSTTASTGSSWARPYVPTRKASVPAQSTNEEDDRRAITLRDAMFVIEKERGHGGGRGAARGWI